MRELVEMCSKCGKELFCMDGFFNGVHTDDQKILCYDCLEENGDKKENPQS